MKIIIDSILYLSVILFPILLNIFFIAYKENRNMKESRAFSDISLLISLYFGIFFSNYLNYNLFIIFTTITIFLSFISKNKLISLILLVIFIECNFFNSDLYFSLIIISSYLILYYFYYFINISSKIFESLFIMISIILFLIGFNININFSIYNIIIIILYIISCHLSNFLVNKSKEVMKIFLTLKDVKKENFIKLSLFKITHEIKNPLAVVKGYLDMFNVDNKEKSIKYISIIKGEITRTLNLLSDLNDFNKIKINKEYINFTLLLDELKDIFIPYFGENKIDYTFKTEENIMINADAERIKQVLINIIKNGVEASNENDKLLFISYISKDKLFIIIEDTGKGMDEETLTNIFTPFYTTKEYGTGLGLCLSREIIEAHKGTINYSSTLDKGTIVKIVLPIN